MATYDISINAKQIWLLLQDNVELSFMQIKELTTYDDSFIYLAIGWLMRDGKIRFANREDGTLCVEANTIYSELYY